MRPSAARAGVAHTHLNCCLAPYRPQRPGHNSRHPDRLGQQRSCWAEACGIACSSGEVVRERARHEGRCHDGAALLLARRTALGYHSRLPVALRVLTGEQLFGRFRVTGRDECHGPVQRQRHAGSVRVPGITVPGKPATARCERGVRCLGETRSETPGLSARPCWVPTSEDGGRP